MALRETIHDTDIDLFRQELVNLIDLRPGHPIRLIGQAIKLHFQDLSLV